MIFSDWAARWSIPAAALHDLQSRILALDGTIPTAPAGTSEAAISNLLRIEASRKGMRLWRNNVGAGYSEDGSFLRWGLANDSAAVNAKIKSADLIGIEPVRIGPQHLGLTLGRFVSREVKATGWSYSGTPREVAQLSWANLINSLGGNAAFATNVGSL